MYSEIGRTTAEDAARRIKHERKLYMADRSKNDQYDVVAQAEEVLRLYIKRYFDITRQMKAEKAKKRLQSRVVFLRLRRVLTAQRVAFSTHVFYLSCIKQAGRVGRGKECYPFLCFFCETYSVIDDIGRQSCGESVKMGLYI